LINGDVRSTDKRTQTPDLPGTANGAERAGIVCTFTFPPHSGNPPYANDPTPIESYDAAGTVTSPPTNPYTQLHTSAANVYLLLDVASCIGQPSGTPLVMNGMGWNVGLFADPAVGSLGGSWLSELAVGFGPSAGPNVVSLRPGIGSGFPGSGSFSSQGIIKFNTVPLPDIVLANGILRMEFYETFDDAPGVADGLWSGTFRGETPSTLSIQVVPEPATVSLLAITGLLGLRRRRR